MTPLRIVYVWDADYPWDVRTEKICLTLTRAGHDLHLVARNRGWRAESERLPEARVHRMPPWRAAGKRLDGLLSFPAFLNPRWLALLGRVAEEVRPQIMLARDLPLCPAALWVARRRRIPLVLDMAENYPALLQDVWDTGRRKPLDWLVRNPAAAARVERYCIHRVDHILTVIEESAERLIQMGVSKDRVSIVSNTPPAARASANPRRPGGGGSLDLVYLGIMEVARGLGEAIEAVAELRERSVSVRLRLIGGGRDLDLLKARARSLGLGDDSVEFLGYIPAHEEALRIVGEAHIGLLPHYANDWGNTTIPNKLFDYMAAGLAVATSNTIPCARIVNQTGAGVVFDAKDPNSLANAVAQLQDPEVRRRCGEAGQAAVRSRYNWETDSMALLNAVDRASSR